MTDPTTKVYLGDSVYAAFDGYMIVLTTDNGDGASNTIYMEPSVIDALNLFVISLKRAAETATDD